MSEGIPYEGKERKECRDRERNHNLLVGVVKSRTKTREGKEETKQNRRTALWLHHIHACR